MAAGLSALARLVRKGAFEDFDIDDNHPRVSPMKPAKEGRSRGSMGATGARPFQSRNVNAAEDKDRRTLQSPIMQAFMDQMTAPNLGDFG